MDIINIWDDILEERKINLKNLLITLKDYSVSLGISLSIKSSEITKEKINSTFLKTSIKHSGSFFYIISIENKNNINLVKKTFNQFYSNSSKNKTSLKFKENKNNTLIIGFTTNGIKEKIYQELGLSPSSLSDLNLKNWMPKNIEIKLEIFKCDSTNIHFLEYIHSGFLIKTNPMLTTSDYKK